MTNEICVWSFLVYLIHKFMSILKIAAICTLLTSISHAHDGKHDKAEMKKASEELFAAADTEKNGSLTLSEFKTFHAEMQKKRERNKPSEEEMFKEIDTDNSGTVTKEEMKNHRKEKGEKKDKKDRKDKK